MRSTGDPIQGVPCPRCGGLIVYNGNYFCRDREGCGWVFAAERKGRETEIETQMMLAGLIATRRGGGRDTAREEGYLDEDGRQRLTELEGARVMKPVYPPSPDPPLSGEAAAPGTPPPAPGGGVPERPWHDDPREIAELWRFLEHIGQRPSVTQIGYFIENAHLWAERREDVIRETRRIEGEPDSFLEPGVTP